MAKNNDGGTEKTSGKKPETEYTVFELADAATKVFGIGVSPDCVMAAFQEAGKTRATKREAKTIVKNFMNKEVK